MAADPSEDGRVEWWCCSHCGPHPSSRAGWCDLGCGSDYNRMTLISTAPTTADIELDDDGLLSEGNHDDIAFDAGYLTENEYDALNRGATDGR